jgi:transposase
MGTSLLRCGSLDRLTDMRGYERTQDGMFSYVSLEQRVPADHPLRAVRKLTDAVLGTLSAEFDALYAASGRPSIAPEYILRALLLQVFYSVRSERLLVEQVDYNLLFRWFVDLGMDDAVWNHAVFSKNRDRLLTSDVAQWFFAEVNKHARRFMSDEHFTVDGTLIQTWASQKSFRSKDGSDDGDGTNFHGQKRPNKTHESTTDADARLYKKSYGKESKLSYLGHALVENRNGLIAAAMVKGCRRYARSLVRDLPDSRWVRAFHPVSVSSQTALRKFPGHEDWVLRRLCHAAPQDRDS